MRRAKTEELKMDVMKGGGCGGTPSVSLTPLLHYLLNHCDRVLAPGIIMGSPTGSPPGDPGTE